MIASLIQAGDMKTKQAMEDLFEEKPLLAELDEQIVFSQLDEDETSIWSLMLASGYLKQLAIKKTPDGIRQYELALTNKELRIMFRNMIKKWFHRKGASAYNEFIQIQFAKSIHQSMLRRENPTPISKHICNIICIWNI